MLKMVMVAGPDSIPILRLNQFQQIMKKRNCKVRGLSLTAAKVLASDFGPVSKELVATSDEKNYLAVWRLGEEGPTQVEEVGRSDSSPSCLRFGASESEIVLGSSRGLINIWDIDSAKVKINLKGHSTTTTSVAVSSWNSNFLASGSYDVKIKLWDTRSRNCVGTMSHHSMEINCMEISPCLLYLISGSKDSTAKLWDLRNMNKLMHSYGHHEAPVNCLQFSPEAELFCSGGNDRQARQFEIVDSYSCLSTTKTETTPVTALRYLADGEHLFTASNDSLKLWNMSATQAALVDNIESSWKGVQRIFINQKRATLYGLAFSGKEFALFECPLSSVSFSGPKNKSEKFIDARRESPGKKPSFNASDLKDVRNIAKMVENQMDDAMKQYQNKKEQQIKLQRKESEKAEQERRQLEKARQRQKQKQKQRQKERQRQRQKSEKQRQKQREKQLIREKQRLKQAEKERQKRQKERLRAREEEEGQQCDMTNSIHFSKLMSDSGNKNKEMYQQIDLIKEISQDHFSFQKVMDERVRFLKPLLNYWNMGSHHEALKDLAELDNYWVAIDFLNTVLVGTSGKGLSPGVAAALVEKSLQIIEERKIPFIIHGTKFIQIIVNAFREDLISILTFVSMEKAPDLAREQRVQKYQSLFEALLKVFANPFLRSVRNKDYSQGEKFEAIKLSRQLLQDLQYIKLKVEKKT